MAETIYFRKQFPEEHLQLELFWSWRAWNEQMGQIHTNVIMLVPKGMFAGRIWSWRGLWGAARLNVVIEVLQFVTGRGLCEFDVVFHNIIGAAVATGMVVLLNEMSNVKETE